MKNRYFLIIIGIFFSSFIFSGCEGSLDAIKHHESEKQSDTVYETSTNPALSSTLSETNTPPVPPGESDEALDIKTLQSELPRVQSKQNSTVGAPTTNNSMKLAKVILECINLKKDEVLKNLGDNYEIVGTGAEATFEGYYYKDYGLTFSFNEEDGSIAWIDCIDEIELYGVKGGMNFAQIRDKLGTAEVKETWVESPENKAYEVEYVINDCTLQFLSYSEDGADSMLAVYPINNEQASAGGVQTSSVDDGGTLVDKLGKLQPIILDIPPFDYYFGVGDKKESNKIELKKISEKRNNIIDSEEWFRSNGLTLNTYEVPNPFRNLPGNLPEQIPTTYKGLILVNAIIGDESIILIYGENFSDSRYLISMDKTLYGINYALDLSNYYYSPGTEGIDLLKEEVTWAIEENGMLYLSTSHLTYSKDSNGMNSYITALDMQDFHLLWRTQPLVSNCGNFIIIDDVIISGYGFTKEDDFLYILDKYDGSVCNKIGLRKMAEYIIFKGDKLYVRTYDTDYVFKVKREINITNAV